MIAISFSRLAFAVASTVMIACAARCCSASAADFRAAARAASSSRCGHGDLLGDARGLDGLLLHDRGGLDDLLLLDRGGLEGLLPIDLGGLHGLLLLDRGGLDLALLGDLRGHLGLLGGDGGLALGEQARLLRDGDGLLLLDARGLARLLLREHGAGGLGLLRGAVLGDAAVLIGLGEGLLLLHLEGALAGVDVGLLDRVLLLALDAVGELGVRLHRVGDGAQALGVEHVVGVELLHGHHREGGDRDVLEREAVLLELLGKGCLDVLGELLALAVQVQEGLVGGDGAQRVGELALDELADGVLVEVALAERARGGHHVFGDGLDLDVELRRDVGLDLVARDERVLARALDRQLDRPQRHPHQLVEDGVLHDAPADHHAVASSAGAHEGLVGAAAAVEPREREQHDRQHEHDAEDGKRGHERSGMLLEENAHLTSPPRRSSGGAPCVRLVPRARNENRTRSRPIFSVIVAVGGGALRRQRSGVCDAAESDASAARASRTRRSSTSVPR